MSPHPERRDLTGRTAVFLHAHPDDEAIFTAATMHRLARRGARVVLVTATAGEEGKPLIPVPRGTSLAELRTRELERACTELGVARLVLLPFRDSGMAGTPPNDHPRAFARHADRTVADLANLLHDEAAETLVHYDSGGVYGHPDHVAVHRLGRAAARATGASGYQATVDRTALPAVGRHLVEGTRPRHLRSAIGRTSVNISTVVRADAADLRAKRAAMRVHRSQIPMSALARTRFAGTYGTEWFVREGRPGLLDVVADDSSTGDTRAAEG
ncbi:PIG-L family deacetylase [Blastococcus mobilis]|uniref:N-acetylglucosaminyl deacetylase, LmbE family n=1 Tax=Blastococcus mobilis TaxID=1938746 RepID=A0A238UQS3_9ACTN|nr:PIG-L family deacetylase [Blastococcus mobilis]SNR24500.1 N-acetylglucosaminyl deacetylase, LmbE family [Blastococcus mobilis]